jgi:hypothetical protein
MPDHLISHTIIPISAYRDIINSILFSHISNSKNQSINWEEYNISRRFDHIDVNILEMHKRLSIMEQQLLDSQKTKISSIYSNASLKQHTMLLKSKCDYEYNALKNALSQSDIRIANNTIFIESIKHSMIALHKENEGAVKNKAEELERKFSNSLNDIIESISKIKIDTGNLRLLQNEGLSRITTDVESKISIINNSISVCRLEFNQQHQSTLAKITDVQNSIPILINESKTSLLEQMVHLKADINSLTTRYNSNLTKVVPLHRYYNKKNGDHFYYQHFEKVLKDYVYEGNAGFVYVSQPQ